MKDNGIIREFSTGATRDTAQDKLDIEGFINPLVLEEYCKYMHKNRYLSDGTIRDSDNWQKGFGDNHLDVCMKSALRHILDMWKEHRNYKSRDGLKNAICGVIFNCMAYLKKVVEEENKEV